jgi:hypothetical protein
MLRPDRLQPFDGPLRTLVFKDGREASEHSNQGIDILGAEQASIHFISVYHAIPAFGSLERHDREACGADHIDIPIDGS